MTLFRVRIVFLLIFLFSFWDNCIVAQTHSCTFSFQEIKGLGFEQGVTRRDPSDIIKEGNTYYVYYTKVKGRSEGYWGTIWYATSTDEGYTWTEKGEVLAPSEGDTFDNFAVFTPNIIKWKGKFYLYYTGIKETGVDNQGNPFFENNSTTDITTFGVAEAHSPSGPFSRSNHKPVLEIGTDNNSFDSYRIDDVSLLVRDKKIWMYYKGRSRKYGVNGPAHTQMGLAYSSDPTQNFVKSKKPLLDKSHEVLIFPYKKGVMAFSSINKQLNYASDGIHFESYASLRAMPNAAGIYRPDLTKQKTNDSSIWGISMIHNGPSCYLVRYNMNIE